MPARILIVEDEIILAKSLARSLNNLGYEIAGMVSSAEEAVRMAEEAKPALVLMDIKLEGKIDGIEAAEQIRNRFDVPVVYLTGFAEKDVLERAKKTEPYGYLGKPVTLLELRSTIETALYKHEADKRLRESEEMYRLIFSKEKDAIVLTDAETFDFLDVNEAAERLWGYTREELMSMKALDVSAEVEKTAASLRAGTQPEGIQVPLRWHKRKDGTVFPVETSGNSITLRGRKVVCSIIRDITERRRAEEQIKAYLKEKEVLLREIHHRVKNNLAVMSSLLSLQSEYTADEVHKKMFEDTQARVRSMALAHELLYQSESLAGVNCSEYIGKLMDHLLVSTGSGGKVINVKRDGGDVLLSLNTAIPVGFLITELASNCLRHAFPDRSEGEIRVSLRSVGEQEFDLVVKDNGVGMPEDVDLENPKSMGLDLVDTFVTQLHGQIEIRRDKGTEVRIRFQEAKEKW